LLYGSYVFQAQVSVDGKNWSDNSVEFSFNIQTPFKNTLLFTILIIAGSVLVVSLIWLYVNRNQKKLYDTRNSLMLTEQKALRAQMDPHFIFNSLNSIRVFAEANNKKELDQYIDDFSMLFRKILHNSDDNMIKISEEIEFLELYLKIEKIRMYNILDYQIEIKIMDDEFNSTIPSMLLQPLVENALWHGLMPKENDRKLKIGFYNINDEYLEIIVEDNGIGRKKAAELGRNRKKHRSFGLGSVKERIDLINKVYKREITIDIFDLYLEDRPIGTRIIIKSKY
jgi:two-component system LytT family sensor kinase